MSVQDIIGIACLGILGALVIWVLVILAFRAEEGDPEATALLCILGFIALLFGAIWGVAGWVA